MRGTFTFIDKLTFTFLKWKAVIESGRGAQLIGLFMWGLILGRMEFFTQLERFSRTRIKALWIALIASALLYGLQKFIYHLPADAFQPKGMAKWYLEKIIASYLSTAMMALSVLAFMQLYLWKTTGHFLHLLAPCSRISLSVYLTQSFVCVPLFYPFGLGWYETIGQTNSFLFSIAFYIVLIIVAHWWVKRFYYGPVEWIWRSATYMTTNVPFKRKAIEPSQQ